MNEAWRGIGKLSEECGELLQVAGKAIAFPVGNHPDGKGPVRDRFIEECADVYAALDYFCEVNDLPIGALELRRKQKRQLFHGWGLTGVTAPDHDPSEQVSSQQSSNPTSDKTDPLSVPPIVKGIDCASSGHLTLEMKHPLVATMAGALANMLDEQQATNYLEIQMQHKISGALILTLQRQNGKTPHQLRRQAEEELAWLKELVSALPVIKTEIGDPILFTDDVWIIPGVPYIDFPTHDEAKAYADLLREQQRLSKLAVTQAPQTATLSPSE